MILLAFFFCFLVFIFFVKDQIASLQLKQIVVFLNQVFRVLFISLRNCDRVWLLNNNRFRVLHAVDSLDVKHESQSKKVKQFCIMLDADISKRYFLVFHLKIVFNFLPELKQRSSDITGRH